MCYMQGSRWSTGRILVQGIDDQPKPQNSLGAAQPGTQLVQLQVREMKMAVDVLVQGVRVPACSSEPSRHCGSC